MRNAAAYPRGPQSPAPVAGRVRFDHVQQREISGLRVERMQPSLEPGDPARECRQQESHAVRGWPAAPGARGRLVAMDRGCLDVDEPDGSFSRRPDRPFTEHRFDRPDALDASHRRQR